jgi:hypothetical protein
MANSIMTRENRTGDHPCFKKDRAFFLPVFSNNRPETGVSRGYAIADGRRRRLFVAVEKLNGA